jgi:hypothetical protein
VARSDPQTPPDLSWLPPSVHVSRHPAVLHKLALLRDVQGIGFAALTQRDIVRHRLVQDIVDAYEARDNALSAAGPTEEPKQPS